MKQQMGGGEWVRGVGPLETLEEGCNIVWSLCRSPPVICGWK